MGRLIPAGTGVGKYNEMETVTDEPPAQPEIEGLSPDLLPEAMA